MTCVAGAMLVCVIIYRQHDGGSPHAVLHHLVFYIWQYVWFWLLRVWLHLTVRQCLTLCRTGWCCCVLRLQHFSDVPD